MSDFNARSAVAEPIDVADDGAPPVDALRALDLVGLPVAVMRVREDGDPAYLWRNDAYAKASGVPHAEAVGRTVVEVFGGAGARHALDRQRAAVVEKRRIAYEAVLELRTGSRRVQSVITPQPTAGGEVAHLIKASVDLGHVATLLDRPTAPPPDVVVEMEQFVALAAHDLKSPMRKLTLISEVLRRRFRDLGDGKLQLLEEVDRIARGALTMIDDVIAYGRLAGVGSPPAEVRLADMTRGIVLDLADGSSNVERVEPQVVCDDVVLRCDPAGLRATLRNLIENAVVHGASPGAPARVTIRAFPAGEDGLRFLVADDGRGFERPEAVFTNCTNSAFTRGADGFGLLAVRRLVRIRGGGIRAVRPESGVGAQIEFTYPGRIESRRGATHGSRGEDSSTVEIDVRR